MSYQQFFCVFMRFNSIFFRHLYNMTEFFTDDDELMQELLEVLRKKKALIDREARVMLK